jgi:hypothetical protein
LLNRKLCRDQNLNYLGRQAEKREGGAIDDRQPLSYERGTQFRVARRQRNQKTGSANAPND